jgi:sigma-E factor negative regulatory protein RseA
MERNATRELISALADGQLQGQDFAQCVELAASDPAARDAWHTYHLIGDVLRSSDLAPLRPTASFVAKLRSRIEEEEEGALPLVQPELVVDGSSAAANDGSFRWKVVAGVASLAAVGAIGWNAVVAVAKPDAQLAVAQQPAVATADRGSVMIRDARLDEMLAQHHQLGGALVLQTPAGFLRNAALDGPAR